MFGSYSLTYLILIFLIATWAVWSAGIKLSNTTDIIATRFNLGEALGGLIFLAFATNLPEIAIITSASLTHNLGIAIGNILGGIAIQTVVLALIDAIGLRTRGALTHEAASLQLVLEGVLVIIVLVLSIMGAELPSTLIYKNIAPGDFLIVIAWLIGLWLINKARRHLPWYEKGLAPHTRKIRPQLSQRKLKQKNSFTIILIFIIASLVTLLAGVILELSGSAIATKIGWSGVLFGSTILAAVTSLPELTTGLAAVKLGDYTMAVSDIFGGNAFLPTLFLPATILSGQSVLPLAHSTDIYLASLGALLTCVYIYGLIFRPKKQFCCMGIDSIVVLILYIIGTYGLFLITRP